MSFSKWDYCQYLPSSPINYTITTLADHLEGVSHDRINRYLRGEKRTLRLLWENVKPHLCADRNAGVMFGDRVLDKRHARSIELPSIR